MENGLYWSSIGINPVMEFSSWKAYEEPLDSLFS